MRANSPSRKLTAWEAYGDLFKVVEQKRKWSRAQLVAALNEDAIAKHLPKCTYHRRSTEYWEARPKGGKSFRQPRQYRITHVYDFLTEQLTSLGEVDKFRPQLKAIAPPTTKFSISDSQVGRNQTVSLNFESAPNAAAHTDIAALTPTESEEIDHRFVALARSGLYDQAATLAQQTLERTTDLGLMAYWADRVGDAYRPSGALLEASKFYALACSYVSGAIQERPGDSRLLLQQVQTRFGQIIVDAYLTRGAFGEAFKRHDQLFKEAEGFFEDIDDELLKTEFSSRRLHIIRQQAEMLRYLGHYARGLKFIRKLLAEYPKHSFEARYYCRLSETDFLRLLGKTEEALIQYNELEQFAKPGSRDVPGLLGAILWRKSGAFQCLNDEKRRSLCLRDLKTIVAKHPKRYRYVAIYSLLINASGKVKNCWAALRSLQELENVYNLRPDYMATEYAHLCLCRGEIFRTRGMKTRARVSFEKAYAGYLRMECRWGMVRAWIGVCASGSASEFPKIFQSSLEGLDAKLFRSFKSGTKLQPGSLSMNLP